MPAGRMVEVYIGTFIQNYPEPFRTQNHKTKNQEHTVSRTVSEKLGKLWYLL